MKLSAPHVARNRDAILAVLAEVLPDRGTILEVASGTGEHAVHFARHLPGLVFQPSDVVAEHLASIGAWRDEADLENLRAPIHLDTTSDEWPPGPWDAVFCANMIHIAPPAAGEGLVRGAGRVLRPGGRLVLYGPFLVAGRETAPSNLAFDESLRRRDPSWGVRRLEDVTSLARAVGLELLRAVDMPANNLTVVFEKRG